MGKQVKRNTKAKRVGPSRQWAWADKHIAKGHCALCGKARKRYHVLCDEHAVKHRVLRRGGRFKPWRPGGPGRPPLLPE